MAYSRRHAVVGSLALGALAVLLAIMGVVVAAARAIIVPPRSRAEDTEILSVDLSGGTITFRRSVDAIVDGKYGFWFSDGTGHARIGMILAESAESVSRELRGVDFGDLESARRGRLTGWYFLTPKSLGVEFEEVSVETELGPAPAWLIPAAQMREGQSGSGHPWVIQVHGRAVVRSETLRAVPVFRDAGFTSLLVSYRNDGEAPESEDGRYALGDTEWKDVEAAMDFALEHGADSIVLMGWSMGGATALQALTRSRRATAIKGVVLDSPVVDWVSALDYQARSKGIIRPLRTLVYALIGHSRGRVLTGQSAPINFGRLDFVSRSSELHTPILLLHSDADAYVPSTASRALAAARPDIVTFVPFSRARHTRLWNQNPQKWNESIAAWLAGLAL